MTINAQLTDTLIMIVLVGFFPNKEKKETYDTTELFSFAKITDECDRIF